MILSIFLDGIRCRTLWLVQETELLMPAVAAGIVVKACILCLEAQNKRAILIQDWKLLGQEATCSAVNTAFLWWANPLLWKGHTSVLKLDELPELEPKFRSQYVLPVMLREWETHKGSGKHALLWTLISATKFTILAGAVPRLLLSVCKLIVPFFVARVISYVSDYDTSDTLNFRSETGYTLILATALLFLTHTVVGVMYEQAKARTKVMLRSALTSTILHFAAQLEPGEKQGSASLTLVTADVTRAVGAFFTIHELWVTPIEIIFATGLLARQVGYGSVGPLVTVIMGAFASGVMAKLVGPAQKEWMQAIQRRISDTTAVLGSMKETKMLGLIDAYTYAIDCLLDNEMTKSVAFRKLLSILNAAGKIPDSFAPPIAFGLAVLFSSGTRLSISEAFTSLSILALIMEPLQTLTHNFPFAIAALPCFERIQDFIELCSAYDARVSLLGASGELTSSDTEALLPGFGRPLFSLQNANVSVKSSEDAIIKDANLSILPGSFNMVVGKVGTGKTTLLRALLGQVTVSGEARIRTSNIAYCPQTPWLFTGTAKDNIIGKSTEDENWYTAVVTACSLDRDFDDLPLGDATPIGSKGVSLSGGQKQRISLARSLFSRKSVIFVDDVLSGLDWATQRSVWKRVFGRTGLLRGHNVTVVLATHALHLADDVDSVVLLGDDGPGSILQGNMETLMRETKIGDLVAAHPGGHDAAQPAAEEAAVFSRVKATSQLATKVDDTEAELLRKTGDFSLYVYYWKTVGWRGAYGFVGTSLLCAAWPALPQIWLMLWTEANENLQEVNTPFYFWVFAALSVGKMVTVLIAVYYCMVIFAPKGIRVLHSRLLRTTMSAPLSFFVATPPGDLVNRFSRDIEQVDVELPMSMFVAFLCLLSIVRAIILVMFGSALMGIIIIPMILFVYLLQKFYLQTSRQLRYLDLHSSAPLNTHLIEMIDGVATIQAFGWEDAVRADGMAHLNETMKPSYLLNVIQNWLELVMKLFVSAVSVLLITTCVVLPSSTSAGGIALSLTNLLALGGALSSLILSWTGLETSLGAADRLRKFDRLTPKEAVSRQTTTVPQHWPTRGTIDIDSISASYKESHGTTSTQALSNVRLQIQSGEKVAICGRTGSGKSSLLLALFRMLDLNSGAIRIDDIDISTISHRKLRSRMIAVPQEPILLPGTLRFNLRPGTGQGATSSDEDDELVGYLKTVELWETVRLQGGLDSQISDLELSHGQKQLICMARALARKASSPILVLDEAMSSIDKQHEQLMVRILEEHFAQHTVISVVHRLNTVSKFDKIVLLDGGAVAEVGSLMELLGIENGRFRALWEGKHE